MQIQAQCPALQYLCITVKRTKSDAREAEIYRSLSEIQHLQVLFLTLDCSDWRVTRSDTPTDDPSFDEDDRKLYSAENLRIKRGHVRETFINCAVDETLARSIWETICRKKVGKWLESLKLYTTGGGSFGERGYDHHLTQIVENLSRSWLIERGGRGDEETSHVKELSQRSREAREKRPHRPGDLLYGSESEVSGRPVLQIFRRIWGRKEGSKDWSEDWASFPLQNQ